MVVLGGGLFLMSEVPLYLVRSGMVPHGGDRCYRTVEFVYVYMYIYMYIYVYIYLQIYVYIYLYIYMYKYIHIYVYRHMYICIDR